MSIWVRSQDKLCLMRVEALPILNHDKDSKNTWSILGVGAFQYTLGTYKSKERAIEVLDEIEAFIENNYISIDDMPSHNNSPYPNYCPTHFTTTTRKKVFKMPEE